MTVAQSHAAAFCRPAIRRGSDMFFSGYRRLRCRHSFGSGYCLSSYALKIPLSIARPHFAKLPFVAARLPADILYNETSPVTASAIAKGIACPEGLW